VRVEEREKPRIVEATDAISRAARSALGPYVIARPPLTSGDSIA
jgi:hypothetical protein